MNIENKIHRNQIINHIYSIQKLNKNAYHIRDVYFKNDLLYIITKYLPDDEYVFYLIDNRGGYDICLEEFNENINRYEFKKRGSLKRYKEVYDLCKEYYGYF